MIVYNVANAQRKDAKNSSTIQQLSICDQRFGNLMIVSFNDHRPPNIPDGILSYMKKGERTVA